MACNKPVKLAVVWKTCTLSLSDWTSLGFAACFVAWVRRYELRVLLAGLYVSRDSDVMFERRHKTLVDLLTKQLQSYQENQRLLQVRRTFPMRHTRAHMLIMFETYRCTTVMTSWGLVCLRVAHAGEWEGWAGSARGGGQGATASREARPPSAPHPPATLRQARFARIMTQSHRMFCTFKMAHSQLLCKSCCVIYAWKLNCVAASFIKNYYISVVLQKSFIHIIRCSHSTCIMT